MEEAVANCDARQPSKQSINTPCSLARPICRWRDFCRLYEDLEAPIACTALRSIYW
jgi:hypothetical protein